MTPSNNPKLEINNIYVDAENIVATDTTMILIKPHGWDDIVEPFMIVNSKAKSNVKTTALWNNLAISREGRYAEYKRMIPKDLTDEIELKQHDDLKIALYKLVKEKNVIINFLDFAVKLNKLNGLLGAIKYANVTKNMAIIESVSGYKLLIVLYSLYSLEK